MLTCRRTSQVRSHHQNFGEAGVSKDMSGDEGLCSGGTRLNSIFITAEDMEEEFQGAATRDVGAKTHRGPTEPVLQTQQTPSPSLAFIKENIDVLRTMIKEHDQQAKMKATPRKLAFADSDKEALAGSLAKGFSDRFSLESSGTSDTRRQTRSTIKSQKTPSKNKEPTHLRSSMTKYPKRWTKCLKGSEPSLGEKWPLGQQKWSVLLKGTNDTFVRHVPEDLKEPETGADQEKHEGIWGKKIKEAVTSGKLAQLVKDICRNNQQNGNPGRNDVKVISMIRQEGNRKRSFEEKRSGIMNELTF
nr:hypothetical protein [Tanacetum cinerariifolium]